MHLKNLEGVEARKGEKKKESNLYTSDDRNALFAKKEKFSIPLPSFSFWAHRYPSCYSLLFFLSFFLPFFSSLLFLVSYFYLISNSLHGWIGVWSGRLETIKSLFLVFLLCGFPSWLILLFSIFFFPGFMKYTATDMVHPCFKFNRELWVWRG